MSESTTLRPVIICTEHRGVFYGRTDATAVDILRRKIVTLEGARMAIYFGTTRGVVELAETGPTDKSRIGARAPSAGVGAITAVFEMTAAAAKAWDDS